MCDGEPNNDSELSIGTGGFDSGDKADTLASRRRAFYWLKNTDSGETNCSQWQHRPETRIRYAAVVVSLWGISMTAIMYGFVRAANRRSDFAVVGALSLAGLVLNLTALRFGLDFGSAILA